ncbi:MAG TPA: formylglycine-generating enzyme family protein [Burkholderiales bacterium]|nr:formylglycine-generating enzyme family protein [Burkholderiales bacterium]
MTMLRGLSRKLLLAALLVPVAAAAARDCDVCPDMVNLPAGRFLMGAAPGEEARENLAAEFRKRSRPQRTVEIRAFRAGRAEVTRGEYRAFAEATGRKGDGCFAWNGREFEPDARRDWRTPGYAQDDGHPATCVSWEDASAYVAWLSSRSGKRYRLLSEAEWEYAARAGSTTPRFWGADANAACAYANGADRSTQARVAFAAEWNAAPCDDGHAYTAPVGSFRPNAFGLHDMLGNAAEWTQDCWNPDHGGAPADGSARTSGDCALRAVRGGSWEDAPVGVRAAYRVGSPTTVRVWTRGFRVAADP